MARRMTEFGAGPRFAALSAIYCLFMLLLTRYFPKVFLINVIPRSASIVSGTVLILVGIPFYFLSLFRVIRAFKAKQLLTRGTFAMCRHPVYGAWIVFFVPGIALLMNSWALLSAAVVMYLIAAVFVKSEDAYLEETFGGEYLSYRQRVPAIFPYGWFKRST